MKKKITLKDIAEELGVSTTLVSLVINNKEKEGRVGKEIAKKIRETAKRLNYQPNYIAKSLRQKKTHAIGLVVADISNPFFSTLAKTIEDEANRYNYTVIIGSSNEDPDKMEEILKFLTSRQVDGFIIVPTEGCFAQISSLKKHGVPFVLLDRYFKNLSTNYVTIDNFKISQIAVQCLLKKGYKKIGVIGYKSKLCHFKDRINGYKEALKVSNIRPVRNLIKEVKYTTLKQDIKSASLDLIQKEQVEAIYFTTNTLALEGLKCIFRLGIKIPDELDVIAFDHSEVYYFFHYPIPHVIQPIQEMGTEVTKILIDQIESTNGEKIKQICLQASLEIEPHFE